MEQPQLFWLCTGALLGLAVHRKLFIHGEWHLQAPKILFYHLLLLVLVLVQERLQKPPNIEALLKGLNLIVLGYLGSLTTSIVVYRLFFHRLTRAGIPGPFHSRITKLWHLWQCRKSKNHLFLDRLHHEYGDFVRTGEMENELMRIRLLT